jgi:hypothetical protein
MDLSRPAAEHESLMNLQQARQQVRIHKLLAWSMHGS